MLTNGVNVIYLTRKNKNHNIDLSTITTNQNFSLCIIISFFNKSFTLPVMSPFIKCAKQSTLKGGSTILSTKRNGLSFNLSVIKNAIFNEVETKIIDGKLFEFRGPDSFLNGVENIYLRRRDNEDIVECKKNGSAISFSLEKHFENDSRWDFYTRINGQEIPLKIKKSIDIINDEDRYQVREKISTEIEDGLEVCMYMTEGSKTLSLWIANTKRIDEVICFAEGKTVYYNELNNPIIENLIVFESFFGKNYSGQPKYIYEYIKENCPEFKCVWSYNKEEHISGAEDCVKRGSKEYYRYLARAKYWVGNIVFPIHTKRKETIYLQTWHGTPLKRLGFDIEVEGPEVLARENFYIESRNWDYLISQNRYSTDIFKRAFKYKGKFLEVGYPHNDLLSNKVDDRKVEQIKNKIGLPKNKKVVLYAPTWRDDQATGSWEYEFGLALDFKELASKLSKDTVFLIRGHHLVNEILVSEEYKDFIYDVSKFDDVQDLALISDILITDYSSVFFDFSVTRKPILFYVYDYKEYKEKLRGFYVDMDKEMPGPLIYKQEDLINAIENIEEINEEYKLRYESFTRKYNYLDNGNCAQQVVEEVFR
ncbi:CDP-glycerol glycerophosphotransferase family protein [Vibrio cyclitrophicus]|uniref:CDP-glycerol glycerophosphotransferase family protein n=1 Tax=Vibrio cyclitrophicus ZF270 TaxID=1136176 RepID=A0AAN0N890_9VIBR|nr:CDP-glycerol glycerophosphotransferase family protein [Vibrio cyclitrophicus]